MRNFKLAQLILSIVLLTSITFAQECDSTCCEVKQNQIQFHLVNDYSISYLKMLFPNSGLRFKIDLGLSGNNVNMNEDYRNFYQYNQQQHVYTHNGDRENSNSHQYVNLVLSYIMIKKMGEGIDIYYGAGPMLSFSRSANESNMSTSNINQSFNISNSTKTKYSEHTWGIGLQTILGVEVSITQKLSLIAEFNLNGTYSWNKYSNSNEQKHSSSREENESNGTSWNYGLNQLKLGSAYRF